MKATQLRRALPALALTLPLQFACQSNGMVSSLDDLTAQVDQQGLLTLQQQRLVALSGLIPEGAPGSLYRFRGTRSPFTAIGISDLRHPDDAGNDSANRRISYYVRRTIECDATDAELLELRDKLVDVRLKASALIRARIERVAERAKKEPDTKRIEDISSSIDATQSAFDDAWKDVVKSVHKPGLVIVRTDRKSTTSLATKIGAILGLTTEEDQEVGGFAIAAGLRTSFLYLGNDLKEPYWPIPYAQDWNLIGTSFPFVLGTVYGWVPIIGQLHYEDIQVVTSKLEARRLLYVRDQLTESRIQGDLKASVDQLKRLKDTLSKVDEVAIDGVLESVESLGNLGILGAVEQDVVRLNSSEAQPDAAPRESWQTLYEVLSDYDDLRTFTDGRVRLHLTNFF